MNITARQAAFNILIRIERNNAYSNLAIDSQLGKTELDSRDRALATALTMGVVDKKLTLDSTLSHYLSKPIKALSPELLTVLRLGAFQILFFDRIPDSAAVNESVKLCRSTGSSYAAGLVNAVLRKICASGAFVPDGDGDESLSIKYSIPVDMLRFLVSSLGRERALSFLGLLTVPKTVIRVNSLKLTRDALIEELSACGVVCNSVFPSDGAIEIISSETPLHMLDSFNQGHFHIQGAASQLASSLVEPLPGQTVIDLCAAPGGKSFTVSELMTGEGRVISCDINPARAELICAGAERLGIGCIETYVNDAAVFNPSFPSADAVLCDVPCSGLGVIGKKPELKYKNHAEFPSLYPIQQSIINTASRYVKPGGRLVYSTCTVNPCENRDICNAFLDTHREFTAVDFYPQFPRDETDKPYLTLLPDENICDGFFMAAFIKNEDSDI